MKVVNVLREKCTHYIGRGRPVNGVNAQLGNPFRMDHPLDREEVIKQFEAWVRSQPEVLERIRQLPEDAVLGCWCKPQDCHGDVIVKLWHELHAGR